MSHTSLLNLRSHLTLSTPVCWCGSPGTAEDMGGLEQNGPGTQVFLQMWPSVRGEGLPSLSLLGLPQSSPGWRQKPGLGEKLESFVPQEHRPVGPSVIPSLLWINFKVRVSTGMSPGLISAQARGRQAGRQAAFCTLSLILKGWRGACTHRHTQSLQSRTTQDRM